MCEKIYTEGALRAEPAKLYPSLRESDSLDFRLKEINSINNSYQNFKDIQNFYNHECKKYKKKSKTYKIINGLIQSIDGVSLLGVSSTAITLSVTGVGLIVIPIASGIGAGVSIISKILNEYLKRKEQHNIKNILLLVEHYMTSVNYIQNV